MGLALGSGPDSILDEELAGTLLGWLHIAALLYIAVLFLLLERFLLLVLLLLDRCNGWAGRLLLAGGLWLAGRLLLALLAG